MHATIRRSSALLFALTLAGEAKAAPPPAVPPPPPPPGKATVTYGPVQKIPQAPDACGKGWYAPGPCGMVYGPNYYLYPCYLPPNGLLPYPVKPLPHPCVMPPIPGVQAPCPTMAFPTHPYARSPRDFFMLD